MTHEEFAALIERVQKLALRYPKVYRPTVIALAALGYAYILFFLGLALLLLSEPGLWFLSLPLLYVILRSLWVRLEAPDGVPLRSDEAPRLFAEVRRIARALHRRPFDRILLTSDFNAGAAQVPRLGLLGWYRGYLLLGLPYLLALSPEEFDGVLAHEFAHLFGAHGRLGGWIYRTHRSWQQLMENLEKRQSRATFLFRGFFRWYAPTFAAAAFTVERINEREADAFAADWAGKKAYAESLLKTGIFVRFLMESFWPRLFQTVATQPEPPCPYKLMREAFRAGLPPEKAQKFLDDALRQPTTIEDPHPSLSERIAALSQQPHVPSPAQVCAAEYLLGAALPRFMSQLGDQWRESVKKFWTDRHQSLQSAQERLRALEATGADRGLTDQEYWELAQNTEILHGGQAALPHYRAYLEKHPDHLPATYCVGRILLSQGEAEGIPLIDAAMNRNPDYILEGCSQIYAYLVAQGDAQQARPYAERHERRRQQLQFEQAERRIIRADDSLGPHRLSGADVEKLVGELKRFPPISRAFLVRKLLRKPVGQLWRPDPVESVPSILVVGLVWRWWWPVVRERELLRRIAREATIGDQLMVFVPLSKTRLRRAFRRIPDSRIYRRLWLGGFRTAPPRGEQPPT